jgi:hypothetical protein
MSALKGTAWSKELEPHPEVASAAQIINVRQIEGAIQATQQDAQDPYRVRSILQKAYDEALLKNPTPHNSTPCITADQELDHEFVLGLNLEEAATLLNLNPQTQPDLMNELYNTALAIKER